MTTAQRERLAARRIPDGYVVLKETPDAIAYVSPDGLIAKMFKGTSAKPLFWSRFPTKGALIKEVESYFARFESWNKMKMERKQCRKGKPTLATLKAFIRDNKDKLLVKVDSSFDGMTDCVQTINGTFRKAFPDEYAASNSKYTLGVRGLWLVGSSRDTITPFESDEFIGYEVYNSCGQSTVAMLKV